MITRIDLLPKDLLLPTSKTVDYDTITFVQENLSIEDFEKRLERLTKLQWQVGSNVFQFTQQFGFSDQLLPSNNIYGGRPGKLFDVNMPGTQVPSGPLLHYELPSHNSAFEAIKDFLLFEQFSDFSDSRLGHLLVYVPVVFAQLWHLELQGQELTVEIQCSVPVDSLTLEVAYQTNGHKRRHKITPHDLRQSINLEFAPTSLQVWLFSKRGELVDFHDETNSYSRGANPVLPKAAETAVSGVEMFIGDGSSTPVKVGIDSSTKVPNLQPKEALGRINVPIRALADSPSDIDHLEFLDYVQALEDFIENENTQTPLTIGVDGAWGSGKTTLMKMLQAALSRATQLPRQRHALTVWFNAWKYDQEESLWAAFALEILAQVRRQLGVRQRLALWFRLNLKRFDRERFLAELARSALYPGSIVVLSILSLIAANRWLGLGVNLTRWSRIIEGTGVLTGLTFLLQRLVKLVKTPFELGIFRYVRQPEYKERLGFLGEFERDFKFVIDAVTRDSKLSLVIFVDDLDRCKPAKPVEVIEAIHQLLDAKPCVFVIGMDIHTVAASVQTKYKEMEAASSTEGSGSSNIGYRFLEKIIQIPFHIPSPSVDQLKRLVNACLSPMAYAKEDETQMRDKAEDLIIAEEGKGKTLDEAARAVESAMPGIKAEILSEAKQNIFAKSFDDDPAVRTAIDNSVFYLGRNPRKLKRFINVFRLEVLIANRRGLLERGTIHVDRLATWLVLTMKFPEFVDLVTDRNFLKRLREARELRLVSPRTAASQHIERAEILLRPYLTDVRIGRFVDASELFLLLDELTPARGSAESLPDFLAPYLELTSTLTVERDLSASAGM